MEAIMVAIMKDFGESMIEKICPAQIVKTTSNALFRADAQLIIVQNVRNKSDNALVDFSKNIKMKAVKKITLS